MKRLIIFFSIIVVLIFSSCFYKMPVKSQKESSTAAEESKKSAPDFSLINLNGDKVTLSNLKGKVVVLNFYTTWCSYCKAELPGFLKVMDDFKGKKVEFLFIDVEEDKETVENFIKSEGYSEMKPLLDSDGSASEKYSVRGFPTTYIIDSTGSIYLMHEGYMEDSTLKSELGKIVK
jgi:peroxiredoxin